ncbi:MAG: hypothetical protein II998_11295 [Clostridia bacterium]|nr:hypothetical protein [Clostridia bacterium]
MCNISGYIGTKQAAPILVEMLKREEIYDGGYSTGVCTIHNGKLYYKRVLGNVDDFLKEVDLDELPGTIGIAHSRPSNSFLLHGHPYISNNERIAMVSNGTTPPDEELAARRDRIVNDLYNKGYRFYTQFKAESSHFPRLDNGDFVSALEVVANQCQEYITHGYDPIHAQTKALDDMYSERVGCMINADDPNYIGVCRLSRPMEILMCGTESYIATTRFAFPENVSGDAYSLPVQHACKVTSKGFEVLPYKALTDTVAEISPVTYIKAYARIEEMLKNASKDNPVIYDDIELEMCKMSELWDEQHKVSQYAKVGYDVLWKIHKEGRLKSFIAPQTKANGTRYLANMYIEE